MWFINLHNMDAKIKSRVYPVYLTISLAIEQVWNPHWQFKSSVLICLWLYNMYNVNVLLDQKEVEVTVRAVKTTFLF